MKETIVFLTGAGISAESGLQTFRDAGGLWHGHRVEDVASPEAWEKDPSMVLAFYDARRRAVRDARPNVAHEAIAALEERCEVIVVTQNIDDLHERAGSRNVLHVHGEILKARSTVDPSLVYRLAKATIDMGDLCEKGSQLRPDVVFFGEGVYALAEARKAMRNARRVVVVGTSLTVFPVAGLVKEAPFDAERYVISPDSHQQVPDGYMFLQGKASDEVPRLLRDWP
ncbi:NAD-dependent protein deacylase [Luteibacter aegosomatis]|uniref:SIR2 family NAD-dependent protein deacylase n=1 Tax=Luteibacter aegosomatis TaxID=2911537 RepID=UPI001FF89F1C|nr:Sir2 family NAD-dependent protein deacetylase [Luteibacter aegosomatis]UPG83916.1 NAD-dependent protein deacylase [Luteibacter aegosomatis]